MSQLLDRLNFFAEKTLGGFSQGHGVTTREDRTWEDGYRKRWQHDKIVRSTHGAIRCIPYWERLHVPNHCYGIALKSIVTWRMQ